MPKVEDAVVHMHGVDTDLHHEVTSEVKLPDVGEVKTREERVPSMGSAVGSAVATV